jgi:hypothetical protein
MTSNNNIVPSAGSPADQRQRVQEQELYRGWDVSEEDLVNYKDAQRRGLQFMFSAVRKSGNAMLESPMNKVVSVYQKNEEGDFVIVSMTGNNINDLRVMEMTNEYYGDPEPDPLYFLNKVIEMADDSGMLRNHGDYGSYGLIETAEATNEEFQQWKVNNGFPASSPPKSDSLITTAANSKIGKVLGVILSKIGRTAAGRSPRVESGAGTGKGVLSALLSKQKSGKDASGQEFKMASQFAKEKHQAAMQQEKMGFQQALQVKKLGSDEKQTYVKTDAAVKIAKFKAAADLSKTKVATAGKVHTTKIQKDILSAPERMAAIKTSMVKGHQSESTAQSHVNRTAAISQMKPGTEPVTPAAAPIQTPYAGPVKTAPMANPFSANKMNTFGSTTPQSQKKPGSGTASYGQVKPVKQPVPKMANATQQVQKGSLQQAKLKGTRK